MLKFTFKKQPAETGLRAVGNPYQSTDIKVNKKIVGHIAAPNWRSKDYVWKIRFAVKREPTSDNPCRFKRISFKKTFDEESDARQWIKDHAEGLSDLDLYYFED